MQAHYWGAVLIKVLLVLALIGFAFYVLYRHWLISSRHQFLDRFELPAGVMERFLLKRPELGGAQQALVQQGLQQYFRLCVDARGRFVSMPSQVVDDLWHEFILFTRLYQKFCERALGHYLHHTPAEAMPTPSTATEGIRRAWRLACRHEGIDPREPVRLPLLFGLDARLGIAGGFVYALNCRDAAASSSGAFCASDIGGGCGSGGCGGNSDSSGDGGSSCGSGCGGGGD